MASQEELHTVLAKAAASKTFRDKLTADPASAASSIGVQLDAGQVTAFKGAAQKLKNSSLNLNIKDKVASLIALWI
jgi:hypothetical protein